MGPQVLVASAKAAAVRVSVTWSKLHGREGQPTNTRETLDSRARTRAEGFQAQRHRDSHFRKCPDRALTRPRLRLCMPVESLRSARPRCPCFLALRRDWISRTIGPWHA